MFNWKFATPTGFDGLKYNHHSSLFLCIACLPTAIWLVSLSDTIHYCCSTLAEAASDGFPVFLTDRQNACVLAAGQHHSLRVCAWNTHVLFPTCSLLTTIIHQLDFFCLSTLHETGAGQTEVRIRGDYITNMKRHLKNAFGTLTLSRKLQNKKLNTFNPGKKKQLHSVDIKSPETRKSVNILALPVPSSQSLCVFWMGFRWNTWNKVCG